MQRASYPGEFNTNVFSGVSFTSYSSTAPGIRLFINHKKPTLNWCLREVAIFVAVVGSGLVGWILNIVLILCSGPLERFPGPSGSAFLQVAESLFFTIYERLLMFPRRS